MQTSGLYIEGLIRGLVDMLDGLCKKKNKESMFHIVHTYICTLIYIVVSATWYTIYVGLRMNILYAGGIHTRQ